MRDSTLIHLRRMGPGEFTVADVARRLDVKRTTARSKVRAWSEGGLVEPTGEVVQWVRSDGSPLPGRPQVLYRRSR